VTSPAERIDSLYRTHAPRAFARARRMLGVDADAHEVVHDVFLAMFERPDAYRGESSMSSYLYGAVTNACLNRIHNRDTARGCCASASRRPQRGRSTPGRGPNA
jgi:RNA polymerase sigma factor (sigma-70 family)